MSTTTYHKTARNPIRNLKKVFTFIFLFSFAAICASGQTNFVENKGQWEAHVVARADIGKGAIWLEENGITYQFWDKDKLASFHNRTAKDSLVDFHTVKLSFIGANPRPFVQKKEPKSTLYNYYIGKNPESWAGGALAYDKYELLNIYPFIDLLLESTLNGFKYSFIVHPGGNHEDIKLKYSGADDIFIDDNKLKISTTLNTIEEDAPFTYLGNFANEIRSAFKVDGDIVSFEVEDFEQNTNDLVIDPSVVFASLSLSRADNWGYTATYDEGGNAYTGGTVYGFGYPTTIGAYQRLFEGGPAGDQLARDCGIYKLNEDGTRLLYMTYFGGADDEQPHSLIVNHNNELVVYGSTESNDLPIQGGFQKQHGGEHDIFIAKFSANGTQLLGSTYIGDSDNDGLNGEYENAGSSDFRNTDELVYNYGDLYRGEVVVDSFNNIFVASTTESIRFPVSGSAFQNRYDGGEQDGVVLKISPNCDTLVWSTFLGGSNHDAAYSLDFDKDFNVYVTGGTKSRNFPTLTNSYDDSYGGGMADAYVVLLSNDGTQLLASTLLGTNSYDQSFFVKVGPDNSPYVLGQTSSSSFPVKNTSNNANVGIFITKLKKDLSDIQISKKIGANNIVNISPSAFSVDKCGRVYFSGWGGLVPNDNSTGNTDGLKTTVDAVKRTTDGRDFYMAVYTKDLATEIYATFYGGNDSGLGASSEHVDGGTSRFDKRGVIYQAICAACNGSQTSPSSRFPTTPSNVYGSSSQHDNSTNCNNAVVKIDLEGPALFAEYDIPEIECEIPQSITFTNNTKDATDFYWDMGDGSTYTDSNVTHNYTKPGTYTVQLVAYNPIACNLRDTLKKKITIYGRSEADFTADIDVCTKEVTFNHEGEYGRKFDWSFGDGATSKSQNPSHTFSSAGEYTITLFTDDKTNCADTFDLVLTLEDPEIDISASLDTCSKTITTTNNSKGFESYLWNFNDGDTSQRFSPTHSFNQRGIYNIVYLLNLNTNCEDSVIIPIEITEPEALFDITIDTCSTQIRVKNNSLDATGYRWQTSDNQTFKSAAPLIGFAEGDVVYNVVLIVNPYSACADTVDSTFRMPGQPIAGFDYTSDTCVSALQFSSTSQDAPSVFWTFGNGDTSTARFPFVNFRDTGKFNVRLIAYPGSECPDTQTALVNVDTFRFADFEFELDTCNFLIEIKNQSKDLDSFIWELGDGSSTSGTNPIHEYQSNGAFEVTMYGLKSRNGCRDTFSTKFIIPELPVPFALREQDSCLNTFIFTDTSQFTKETYWVASNGEKGVGSPFRVSFSTPDTHQVSLIVKSDYNCWDTLVQDVIIDSMANARFNIELDSCDGAVTLPDDSYGAFRWNWELDDNLRSRDSTPYVNYEQTGIKQILLIINKGTECEDSVYREIEITEYLTDRIDITNVFSPNSDGKNDIWKVQNLRTDCDEYGLYIYNRWGVLIKEIHNGEDFEWDGTNVEELVLGDGVPVANGVYFYVLISNNFQRTGSITLVK